MKKLVLLTVFCCLVIAPSLALSAPYLVCAPYPTTVVQPTLFAVTVDGSAVVDSPALKLTDNSVRLSFDVGALSVGTHNVSVKAVLVHPDWGRLESAATPFSFPRPGAPVGATGIALSPIP